MWSVAGRVYAWSVCMYRVCVYVGSVCMGILEVCPLSHSLDDSEERILPKKLINSLS